MKKILSMCCLAALIGLQSYGQAYLDLDSIRKFRAEKPVPIQKIAKLVIPYFTTDGVLQKKRLESYLQDKLGIEINEYLNKQAGDIEEIRRFAIDKGNELKPYFVSIQNNIESLQTIRNKYTGIIPDLPAEFKLKDIAENYNNPAYQTRLKRQEDLEAQNLSDTSLLYTELQQLRQLNKITGSKQVTELLKATDEINQLIVAVNKKKQEVHILLNSPDKQALLNQLYIHLNPGTTSLNAEQRFDTKLRVNDVLQSFQTLPALQNPTYQQAATLSSTKLPSQSDMIDALVIFVAKRFSQEIAMTFLDALKQRAKNMTLVNDLFPSTMKLLAEGNNYEVPRMGSIWHYAIAQDINNLPLNLKYSTYIKEQISGSKLAGYYPMYQDLVTIAEFAKSGNSLPEILTLYKGGLCKLNDPNFVFMFDVIHLISTEFSQSADHTNYWIKWERLAGLSENDWDLLLKMLASRYHSTLIGAQGFNLEEKDFKDLSWITFRKNIQQAVMVLNQFEEHRQALISNQSNPALRIKNISFWETQQQLFNILFTPNLVKNEQLLKGITFVNRGMQIYKLQGDGNHPAMIRESLQLMQDLFPKETGRISELLVKTWKIEKTKHQPTYIKIKGYLNGLDQLYTGTLAMQSAPDSNKVKFIKDLAARFNIKITGSGSDSLSKSYIAKSFTAIHDIGGAQHILVVKNPKGLQDMLDSAKKIDANQFFAKKLYQDGQSKSSFSKVMKTAEFFTDVMGASSSTELSEVIKAYALPPNSYKIRRNSRHSIDIDAHIGAYFGAEWLSKMPDSLNVKRTAAVWGLSAPIGLAFSWGYRNGTKNGETASFLNRKGKYRTLRGNSYSLGISLIDIAAPLAFRLSNDSEEALPKSLSWSQIFSPGAHLRFGIENTPFSISTGFQYTPQLRKVSLEANDQQAYRAYAGLFYDMPLFNLYRR